jgi:anti-sigma factor RsiW
MRCLDVQIELEAYADGELSPERAALLERHLVGCDACQAELARLQAVVAALETWPLVTEPAQLTARVMARARPRPALPGFRLHWSDFAISLAGAGLVFATTLLWRYLAPTGLVYLHSAQMYLRLELLRLEVLVLTQYLARIGAVTWGLLLMGVTLVTVLSLAVWDLAVWEREVLSVQAEAR